ncbi:MAG: phenylacetate--CoA ligase family protein [Actinomycetia bacterium]|nr:phenylacetate--CoA ligase family protein [Actinomycetes bacterium]
MRFTTLYPGLLATTTRHVIEPLLGARYLTKVDEIDRFWALSGGEREAWRANALDRILAYVRDQVPAYSGLLPQGDGLDLAALPLVDKQEIFGHEHDYFSAERESIPAIPKHTGGSTGDPWNYPLDRDAWAVAYAVQIHHLREVGVQYGDRRVTLGFPTSLGLDHNTWQKRLRLRAERTDVSLCGLEIDSTTSRRRALEACSRKAVLWYGYASTIAAMAAATLDGGRELVGPSVIITMAEPLWPAWKVDIERAFGSRVIEEYGCNDGGIMAHRCRAGNLHLADNQSIVEILDPDGRPCPEGTDGDIVITNLHARHLPFIRYRNGDVGAFGPCPCPCGRPGRTLARVSGRTADFIKLPDGTELSPVTFFAAFTELSSVRRYQIVQRESDHLQVRLEVRPNWSADDERLIRSWIGDRARHQLTVELVTDEPFEVTRGGKHRVIVRELA